MALELIVKAGTSLADFTEPGLLVPELQDRDMPGVIGELSRALQQHGLVADVLPFYHAALNQELLANSAAEHGIALPHARMAGVRTLKFALGRAPEPVVWGSRGSTPADLVFLLAVPATDAAGYLHLLASIARLGQDFELSSELRAARTSQEMHAVLEKVKTRQP